MNNFSHSSSLSKSASHVYDTFNTGRSSPSSSVFLSYHTTCFSHNEQDKSLITLTQLIFHFYSPTHLSKSPSNLLLSIHLDILPINHLISWLTCKTVNKKIELSFIKPDFNCSQNPFTGITENVQMDKLMVFSHRCSLVVDMNILPGGIKWRPF